MTAEPSNHVTAPTAPPQLTQRQFGGARLGPYRYVHASTAETATKRTGQCKSRNSWSSRVPAPNKVSVIIGTAAMAPSARRIKTAAPKAKSSAVRLKVSDAASAPCLLLQGRVCTTIFVI